ncbi:MAG: AGE family epimerase/isomerase [Pirellulaceae bacterium]
MSSNSNLLLTQCSDELIAVYRDGLLNDTLPFWLRHGVDTIHGGIMTSLDRDGTLLDDDKLMWQQCRFIWLMGELYNNVQQCPEWLDAALRVANFVEQHGFDQKDGRMWFHLDRGGKPIRKRRYAFSESFAAIAFGELALATGDTRYAELARKCFHRFVTHDPDRFGEPKFTCLRRTRSLAVPMITIATAQQLRSSIQLEDADTVIDDAIATIHQFHNKPEIGCVMETVGADGAMIDHVDGRTLNPGHAIEGAWFIMYEGKIRDDERLVRMGCRMLDWMWRRGWDQGYGGLFYFVDVEEKPVQEYWHDMKFWWPQNEAIIATLLAYQLTGDAKYAAWHDVAHRWAYDHFADPEHGEWFGYLHRDGHRSSTLKGSHWKGPFHLPRMQLTCWKLLEGTCL